MSDIESSSAEDDSPANWKVNKIVKASVDRKAAWTKKAGKIHYGYKKHHATDMNGLVLAVETTPANVHDGQILELLIERSEPAEKTIVLADKGYCSKANDEYLRFKKLKNGIMKKANRNQKLSTYHKKKNKAISKFRYVVERTFGSQKRWFGAAKTRYLGLDKTNGQHIMEAICYNLKRAPRLLAELHLMP